MTMPQPDPHFSESMRPELGMPTVDATSQPAAQSAELASERDRGFEWVARIRAGDRMAFSELFAELYPRVLAFIRRRLDEPAEAEDLTQETFVQLLRSIDSFEGRSSLLCWTFGIAHHVCGRHFRNGSRRRAKLELVLASNEPPVETRIESRLDAAHVFDRCIGVLESRRRPEHREIFRLRYAEHHSVAAIAAKVGQSNDSVRASLKRSRIMLSTHVPGLRAALDEVARIA